MQLCCDWLTNPLLVLHSQASPTPSPAKEAAAAAGEARTFAGKGARGAKGDKVRGCCVGAAG